MEIGKMKLKIYTNHYKKFKEGLLREMAKEPLIVEDVESYEEIK